MKLKLKIGVTTFLKVDCYEMNKLRKIDNIMFYVKDLEKSAKFYEEILGLKKVWTNKKRRWMGFIFEESDSEIVLHSDKSIPNPDFSFLVDNVENFCKEYKEKGYKVVREPFEVRPGKFAILEDLDGNTIQIIDLTKFKNKPLYD